MGEWRCTSLLRGGRAMNGPPSLVRYDQPVTAEDQAAQNLQSKLRAAKLQDKNLGNLPNGDDILHMILPPREFEDAESKYVQCVSAQPASRFDVITLQEHLDRRMVVREELYSQCFDELIRQVTLNLPERGLLLLRVR